MYRLTPRMQQILRQQLAKYHDLFSRGCSGTCLEEMIFQSIRLANDAQHYATWKRVGHDSEADICVTVNGETYPLDIKSGIVKGRYLKLSGPRLGRFEGDLEQITAYLNSRQPEVLSVSYRSVAEDRGVNRYQIIHVDATYFHDLNPTSWEQVRKRWEQTNQYGVISLLNPVMGWKLRWKVPEELVDMYGEFFV
ncbi:MAG: hypothetical protein OXU36_06485 [Candidatus Poribacteria bacterium]|nr:hypothetical protein [Candidatus Poribacteria bacterium]